MKETYFTKVNYIARYYSLNVKRGKTSKLSMESQDCESFCVGKFCNMNFPAFHNLLVNALLEVNLSVDRLRSWKKGCKQIARLSH